jgi:hypothetical protein
MASSLVRTEIKNYLTANWTATAIFDLSDYLRATDFPVDAPWLGIQFLSSKEETIHISGSLNGYRERGVIFFHLVIPNGFATSTALTFCEDLRNLFRGKRIGEIAIIRADPPTDTKGTALLIKGPWYGMAVPVAFQWDHTY